MSPLDIDLGVDLDIVDEALPAADPTATDTCFLLHPLAITESPDDVQLLRTAGDARDIYPGETALFAYVDAFFGVSGGGQMYVAPLLADEAASVALFDARLGPGQIVAPTLVADADQEPIKAHAWANNRIYIANVADAANQAALLAAATGLIDDDGGRNTMLEADTLLIPGAAPGTTREVRASIVKAALMARSDRITGNPNLAAAGNHTPGAGGVASPYVLGIKAERSTTEQKALAAGQVNCFRTVNGTVRSYGYWTLADLAVLPHWWDMGGSRTVMAVRAMEEAVAEELMFGQVAADGAFLDRYKGALSGVLSEFQRIGAIYGTAEDMGYSVDVSVAHNPPSQVQLGKVTAQIIIRTSPFGAELKITLTRRAITEPVA